MNPHDDETIRHSTRSAPLEERWDRYLLDRTPRAHRELLRAVEGTVRAEARRRLGRRHPLFEEAVQESLVGVARRIATGERPDHPVAYIRRIVHNKVVDLLERESSRRRREEGQWTPAYEPNEASVSADWHDFLATLRGIVSNDEFWTLVLRYHFDYSYGEIGRLLDKEPNAIRQIALRGRRKCREQMSRLQGRVPAWVGWPAADSAVDGAARREPEPDPPGLRQPRNPDPVDRPRRSATGSDSGRPPPGSATPMRPLPTRTRPTTRSLLLTFVTSRPLGSPATVLPLALLVALPVLVPIRGSSGDTGGRPVVTAVSVGEPDAAVTSPSGGPSAFFEDSTAPTDAGEAPSTSAPVDPAGPTSSRPDGSTTARSPPDVPPTATRPDRSSSSPAASSPPSPPSAPSTTTTTVAPTTTSPTITVAPTTARTVTTPTAPTTTTTTTTPTTTGTAPTTTVSTANSPAPSSTPPTSAPSTAPTSAPSSTSATTTVGSSPTTVTPSTTSTSATTSSVSTTSTSQPSRTTSASSTSLPGTDGVDEPVRGAVSPRR